MKKTKAMAIAIRKEEALLYALLPPFYAIGEFMYGNEKRTRASFTVAAIFLVIAVFMNFAEQQLASQGMLACYK